MNKNTLPGVIVGAGAAALLITAAVVYPVHQPTATGEDTPDWTVPVCTLWENDQNPTLPPYTLSDVCQAADGTLSTPEDVGTANPPQEAVQAPAEDIEGHPDDLGYQEGIGEAVTVCADGYILAEDYSCVGPDFYTLPDRTLIPCPVEDYAGDCYWDAARMGNGQGTSFIVLDGQVYYPEVG